MHTFETGFHSVISLKKSHSLLLPCKLAMHNSCANSDHTGPLHARLLHFQPISQAWIKQLKQWQIIKPSLCHC